MALRMGALYDALRASSEITEEQARLAAEEGAAVVERIEQRMTGIERDLHVLKWMVGTTAALTLLVLGQLLALTWRVSELAR